MVRAMEQEQESYISRLFHFKGTNDTGKHAKSLSVDSGSKLVDESPACKSQEPKSDHAVEKHQTGGASGCNLIPKSPVIKDDATAKALERLRHDMEQMKEKFGKLLLGEDMSGGGKGVSSALALSNAITNLAASVFSEQSRLEPMSAETKGKWRREVDWLLSVTDHIVEFVASQQKSKDGTKMDIMVTKQRNDLHMNIPALRKLDAMLVECLENFKDQSEFSYISKDAPDSEKGNAKRKDEKWWLPTPKVPTNGLSETARKFLQNQKDSVNQVLKAAMAINAQVLSEMEIPENYIDSLPKNGRASLGDAIYRSITVDFFNPDQFLSTMDLSSEHKILDLKDRIEASVVIWRRKMNQKDGKSSWGSAVSLEKREQFEERAETILLIIKHRYPGIPQSSLDISKIEFNRDVGHAVLESYSRVLESLAFTVLSRIEDVLYADFATQNPTQAASMRNSLRITSFSAVDRILGDSERPSSEEGRTLLDFMGWAAADQAENEGQKEKEETDDESVKEGGDKFASLKVPKQIVTNKMVSYLETLGGLRSPTSRH